jgi:hypothetical protein
MQEPRHSVRFLLWDHAILHEDNLCYFSAFLIGMDALVPWISSDEWSQHGCICSLNIIRRMIRLHGRLDDPLLDGLSRKNLLFKSATFHFFPTCSRVSRSGFPRLCTVESLGLHPDMQLIFQCSTCLICLYIEHNTLVLAPDFLVSVTCLFHG